ncbi:MAG: 50S ribosomal protein L15 [Candidatus Dadabacteria bacterium]|nr:50S ribosomal protein L15 [Candidatus Dadabacteria bacterium]NIV40892.1 50S ribosomal protein L15 [Candidatus Dadabacteria bacterium]NIX16142.1 50S ribosomal protein L15 [Candidatus Dadabacteria bacterium]
MLNELKPTDGAKKKRKRIGRGPGSSGKTSGKGHKGQRSRSGGSVPLWFEGGQTPLKMRSPKRGFTNINKVEFDVVNVGRLDIFDSGEVTPESLREKGLVSGNSPIKILGNGDLSKSLNIKANGFSASAKEKIEKQGGTIEII